MLVRSSDENKWTAWESSIKLYFSVLCFENHFPAWMNLLTQHAYGNIIVAKEKTDQSIFFLKLIVNLNFLWLQKYRISYLNKNIRNFVSPLTF